MILRYILKGFRRHVMRTIIIVLALVFVAAMLVVLNNTIATSRRQVVDLIAREVGEQDITITRVDTSPDPFIDVESTSATLRSAHRRVSAVHPRFQASVEVALDQAGPAATAGLAVAGLGTSGPGNATLIARAPEIDDLGTVEIQEGEYDLSGDQVVILRDTADAYGLEVGDEVLLSYVLPVPREVGRTQAENMSVNRITRRFVVSGIALQNGLGSDIQNGVLAHIETVQRWLGLPGRAERLVVALDPAVYNAVDVQTSVFRVRRIAERMQSALIEAGALGSQTDELRFVITKAETLDGADLAFSMLQTMTMVYGFLSMGVVGLLVYSLINANVDDRRRDLAFMRIIGARRRKLFALVLIEVALVGAIGVGLGTLAGQALSTFLVDRVLGSLVANMIENEGGLGGGLVMAKVNLSLSPWSLVSTALIAGLVLLLSALAPANKAASTKIRYALDPGSADNIQLEDLAALRERNYNWNITLAGVVLTIMWGLVFMGQNYLFAQGNETVLGAFMFGGMALLILGVSLLFFTLTVPLERLVLLVFRLISPRLTFFARRNVTRAKRRNTVIALMIVFSATLPTFLGTTAALTEANFDVNTRQSHGAPINSRIRGGGHFMTFFNPEDADYVRPGFISRYTEVEGVGPAVGLTYGYSADMRNRVQLRKASVEVHGITASPLNVVYPDLTDVNGGEAAFRRMFAEPDAILLTTGFAEYLDVGIGDTVIVSGEGLDHVVPMHIVGLVERLAGFWNIGRNLRYIRWGGSVGFVSMDTFLRLTNDPNVDTICIDGVCSESERDAPVIDRVLAGMDASADPQQVVKALRKALSDRNDIRITVTAEEVRVARQGFQTMRIVLFVLTILSLITSVLGVFSVIYVTIQTRRLEIGMLKAIGITGWQLVGTFAIESLSMTVSATLTGTVAGTGLGYVFYISNNMMQNVPTLPAFDTMTVTFVLVMVIVASLISAAIASRGIVRQRVTQILRGV
jgi:ABC-type antimicrobial peptide transport system permease subunit